MIRRTVAIVVTLTVLLAYSAPAFAQGLNLKESIGRALAATTTTPPVPRRMARGYKWTGIGLVVLGGLYLFAGMASAADCTSYYDSDCRSTTRGIMALSFALAGTGTALLVIGADRSSPSPTITFVPRGVVIQHALALPFGKHRK